MFLLTIFVRLLFAIRVLGNEHILVFWALFEYLLRPILNNFENNLDQFLVF
jgi:hypothetical protein